MSRLALPVFAALFAGAGGVQAADTFSNGVLSIPVLQIGSSASTGTLRLGPLTFSGVEVTLGANSLPANISSYQYGSPTTDPDTYDTQTGQLMVQEAIYNSVSYYGVPLHNVQLKSIGGASGADSYAGGKVTIPQLQLGSTTLNDVTVSVAAIEHYSFGGGLPTGPVDSVSADTAGYVLYIPAGVVGGNVFTNITVQLGSLTQLAPYVTVGSFYSTLHSFSYSVDGEGSYGSLARDSAGNLYGTTSGGGSGDYGTVYQVAPSGAAAVLYAFKNRADGGIPRAGVILDGAGNVYGTTSTNADGVGSGTVFKLSPSGTLTTLHTFLGGADGDSPSSGLLMDSNGNLYGTTTLGGASDAGTVYEITAAGTEEVLHSFSGGTSDGAYPSATLIMDGAGNLYGTTENGGASGAGTVFALNPATHAVTIIHSFAGGTGDGANPEFAGVIMDGAGNLYGTTSSGGTSGSGTVFRIDTANQETVLYNFSGGADGSAPDYGVVMDANGNLYGTTYDGGTSQQGAVFRLTPSTSVAGQYSESVLYSFPGVPQAGNPNGGLILDSSGTLYGVTEVGGPGGAGIVYKLGTDFPL